MKPITKKISKFHDKYYKHLLLIPVILIIFSVIFMVNFYQQTGDFIYKDVSLTGGTSVTIYDKNVDRFELKEELSTKLEEITTRKISDLTNTQQKGIIIETKSLQEETKQVLEDYLGYNLTQENSSFEFTGSSLGESFYRQLLLAIFFAFVFMAIVVFILFKKLIPSAAVIVSAFADILMTLIVINLIGLKLSIAGIVAFLMLIGYSVDTDILLTTRLLKRRGKGLNQRIFGAFKTGITMTLTSLVAILVALFFVRSVSPILTQMFTVLSIGLGFDILNTWITNVSLLKWGLTNEN
jgi:preprotein translocase subunit SecF